MTSLRGHERREFPLSVRKAAFARACKQCLVSGVENIPGVPQCENCGKQLRPGGIQYEHLQPDGLQGEPTLENCGCWCTSCSKAKDKTDNAIMAKADRVLRKNYGLRPTRAKIKSRGFAPAAPQHSASRPLQKGIEG